MENLIGQELANAISHIERKSITELRFRLGKPLQMECGGEISDVINPIGKKIIVEKRDLKEVILNFANGSFFSKECEIKDGFLSKNGARLGICGVCDFQTGEISSIANVTSLALRLPFKGKITPCIHAKYVAENLSSTLVISPYGAGKTTFLKKILLSFPKNKKVFLCDERGEFAYFAENLENVDHMQNSKKNKSFEIAIRLFSPHAIMIDEMFYQLDSALLAKARMAGIAIYASFHGRCEQDYQNSEVYKSGIFKNYVILSEKFGKGTVEKVLDENFAEVKIYKKQ
ncbi:MAG: hypothetical protein R3Y32_02900 [Bacillota bacterium]